MIILTALPGSRDAVCVVMIAPGHPPITTSHATMADAISALGADHAVALSLDAAEQCPVPPTLTDSPVT